MLFQEDEEKVLRLVYAISRRTSDVEKSYHSSKLELMAIVWAMERLRPFLIGIPFIVLTDCQALVHINTYKTKNHQIIRWQKLLADYEFEIVHRSGVQMQHVDALSRAPVEDTAEILDNAFILNVMVSEDEILMYQRKDEFLARKIAILEKAESLRTRREKGEVKEFVLRDGLLYKRCDEEKELYVVPRAMRKALVIKNHDLTSHFGVDRTVARIRGHYYFPKMRSYVRKHIASCIECLFSKHKPGRQAGELHPIPPGGRPFATVHLDHLGPFVSSHRENKYILAAICNSTKFCQLYAVRDTTTNSTIREIEKFVQRFGAPERFVTDRGTSFTSNHFKEFCNRHGIKLTYNSSRHAQANGQVERLNQTILPALQACLTDMRGTSWDDNIRGLERDLNTAVCKTTGRTPFELLYGYSPRFNEGLARQLSERSENYCIPEELRREVHDRVEIEQRKAKFRYDKNRLRNVKFEVGDIVVVKSGKVATGESTKLQMPNKGPLVVTEVLPSDTYRVQSLSVKGKSKKATTAHVSQMKIWRRNEESSDSENESELTSESERELENAKEAVVVNVSQSEIVGSPIENEGMQIATTSKDASVRRSSRRKRKPARFNDYESLDDTA